MLQPGPEIAPPDVRGTHQIVDDEPGLGYSLGSDTVDPSAYEGRRVNVSGWVDERSDDIASRRLMDVERAGVAELEPAGR